MSPPVLAGIIPSLAFDFFMTCRQIAMTLNSRYLVVNGWTKDDIENLRLMLWRHAIIAESITDLKYVQKTWNTQLMQLMTSTAIPALTITVATYMREQLIHGNNRSIILRVWKLHMVKGIP